VRQSPPMGESEVPPGGRASGALPGDEALVAALRRGDEDAFKALVEEYSPFLMRLAMMHVSSRAVAEEVVQDTWVGVLKGLERFQGRSSLRTWIISILLNTARTRGQREGRIVPFALLRRRYEEGSGPAMDPDRFQGRRGERPGWWARPPSAWGSPEEKLSEDETRRVLIEAIKGLPPRQREVIALRDLSGWPSEEVCNALGISETNQRVLLHRARTKVRAALESHFSEEEAA
jgi:RNA polymerase sigma-70 factor, ECF subfamily